MTFKVTSRFPTDTREQDIANFKYVKDARAFIEFKLQSDLNEGIGNLIYKLYDFDEMMEEFDPRKMNITQKAGDAGAASAGQSAQGAGARSSFQPTPLNMTPTPGGLPKKWIKDEEDEDKKE